MRVHYFYVDQIHFFSPKCLWLLKVGVTLLSAKKTWQKDFVKKNDTWWEKLLPFFLEISPSFYINPKYFASSSWLLYFLYIFLRMMFNIIFLFHCLRYFNRKLINYVIFFSIYVMTKIFMVENLEHSVKQKISSENNRKFMINAHINIQKTLRTSY